MMKNLEIYNAVRIVPYQAQKKINGGRLNGKTDINPMWRIKTLTEQFGPCGIGWYYKTIRQWTEQQGDETAAFVNIELYVKVNGEWTQPIFGTGGSMFAQKERSGIYVSDECYKMATTDAISVACKQLGIGADVYWEKDKTKYSALPKADAEDKMADKTAANVETTAEDKTIDKRLEPVIKELNRIGYTENAVCKTYKIDNINKLSNLQIQDFLKKVKNIPDREPT